MLKKRLFNSLVDILMLIIATYTTVVTFKGVNAYWALSTVVLWAGTFGTIMTAKRHKLAGLPNLVQNGFNLIVAWQSGVFGDSIMSLWYAVSEALSLKTWGEHAKGDKVETEKDVNWFKVAFMVLVTGVLLGVYSYLRGGQQIVLDAINNSTGAVAQYMQKIKRQRASWYLWGITNLIGIVLWWDINPIQSAMYTAFLLNTVRGYLNWSE